MKIITIITLIFLLSLIVKCRNKDCHQSVFVINNTDEYIYFYCTNWYPDTSMQKDSNPFLGNPNLKTKPHSKNYDYTTDCDNRIMQNAYADTMSVFIIDAEIVESIPWDSIRKNYMVLKRYDLSLEDLERMNWTVTYP